MNNFFSKAFPVTNIKATLIMVIAIYGFFQLWLLKTDLPMNRAILLECTRENDTVKIKGTTYPALIKKENIVTQFDIHTAAEFLMLSNGEADDCFVTSLIKLGLCILLNVLIWQLDFTDPFNPVHLKRVKLACNLFIALLIIISFKNVWTHQWVGNIIGVQSYRGNVYTYNIGFSNCYYIFLVWLVRMMISFYQKGVENQKELALTI